MSYEPTNWKSGDKVTSTRLNKIEQGIQGNDSEITELKEDLSDITGVKKIEFIPNYYIKTNISSGNEVDLTPIFNRAFSYAIVPVSEGDKITLHAWGWTTGRLWCFVTSENIVISVSGQNVNAASGLELIAPVNSAKLIINSYTESLGDCYVGEIMPAIAAKANSAFDYADSNVIIENEILTSNKTFVLKPDKNFYKNIIVSIDAEYSSSNDSVPSISATRRWYSPAGNYNFYYGSPKYAIGENGKRKTNQFRFPCGIAGMGEYKFTIDVPEGCTLTIHSLSLTFNDFISREASIQLNAHGQCGFGGCANTNLSFNMAAKLGYKYCITIPKVTSDGVYVCFHDDASIQGQARNPDGTNIDAQYQNIPISEFTYDQLLQFDFGIYRGLIFKGEKIPLLSDFFKICAVTGMHPMLSVHPDLSGHWENIKAMAKKYNVLDKLNIKAPMGTTLTAPMSVLLNGVESYTVDINGTTDAVSYMNELKNTYGLDEAKVKLGIEYFLDYATDENIAAALDAGYFVSVATISSSIHTQYTSFIEKGVTQFTDDYCPNVGLNWY